jgi:hypothetical protein
MFLCRLYLHSIVTWIDEMKSTDLFALTAIEIIQPCYDCHITWGMSFLCQIFGHANVVDMSASFLAMDMLVLLDTSDWRKSDETLICC